MNNTYYVAALDILGRAIGIYVNARDFESAWDSAMERREVSAVQAVQLIATAEVMA